MQITLMSLLSIIFYSALFSLMLAVILENVQLLRRIKCEVILVCLAVPVFKMLVPMEVIPWTININVDKVLPEATIFLSKKVTMLGNGNLTRWEVIVCSIWLISLLLVLRELLGYLHFLYNVNKLPELENNKIRAFVNQVMDEYGKRKSIHIKRTDLVSAPSIVGMGKVVLLLPTMDLENIPMEGIIRHEVAHYVHGDVVIQFLWSLVKAINWWNPVVYILNKQIVKVLEVRADEKAIQKMSDEERDEYRSALVILSNLAGKRKNHQYCVSLFHRKGWLIKKRVKVLEIKYTRTRMDLLVNYVGMVLCVVVTFVVMNCFIFEPKGAIPELPKEATLERTKMVTEDSYFLVRNADGTYDMYMDGIYCATLMEDGGSRIPIYNSLEEALQYEEIR